MISEKQVAKIQRLVTNYREAVIEQNDGWHDFEGAGYSKDSKELNKLLDNKMKAKSKLDAYLFSLTHI